jgi:outer membrane receptor protein involved in Fe transport
LQVGPSSGFTYDNLYADLVTGNISDNYEEASFNPRDDTAYNTYEGFVQDSWKLTKRLTLELGSRLTHFQSFQPSWRQSFVGAKSFRAPVPRLRPETADSVRLCKLVP